MVIIDYGELYISTVERYLDGTTDFVTKEFSKKIEFFCEHEEAHTKMFTYIKFLSNADQLKRKIINSPGTDVAVTSL